MKNIYRRKTACLVLVFFFIAIPGHVFSAQKTLPEAIKKAQKSGVSETNINRILVYGYDIRISTHNVMELLGILAGAKHQGYPIEILYNKIDEGLVKRVSFEIIRSVIKKKIRDYRFVLGLYNYGRKKMDLAQISKSLVLAAESLDYGLSMDDLQSLHKGHEDAPIEMFALAANNVALIRQLGIDPNRANKIMQTGLRHRSLTPDWEHFFKVVKIGQKRGISNKLIFDTATFLLSEKKALRVLLIELGFTDRNLLHGPVNPKGAK